MEDSFRVRADKAFGSLPSSRSSSLRVPSPWSVTDDEVERRQWRRATDTGASERDQAPCSPSFLEGEWGIKASIGMDPTLDNEEEEDEHDKVAEGKEGVSDRLFMDEVSHHGSYLNSHNVLNGSNKDRRGNFLAARQRLKEDDAEARKLNSTPASASQSQVKQQPVKSEGGKLKSILKRKGNTPVMKAQKRVRFDPSCVTHCDSEESSKYECLRKVPDKNKRKRKVPDYLVNPSKYTCYSFDSKSKVAADDKTQGCMDYLSPVKGSNSESKSEMEVASAQLPKSVAFVPKKKGGDGKAVNDSMTMKQDKGDDNKQSLNRAGLLLGIAAVEAQSEVSAVEEERLEPNAADSSACLKKSRRNYRSKSKSDESDS